MKFVDAFGIIHEMESSIKPITNAGRIRAMTDEELAEWFYSGDFPWCNFEEDVVPCPYEEMPDPCEHCLLDWLREEADHD